MENDKIEAVIFTYTKNKISSIYINYFSWKNWKKQNGSIDWIYIESRFNVFMGLSYSVKRLIQISTFSEKIFIS